MRTKPCYRKHCFFLLEVEDINMAPTSTRKEMAKKLNESIGYECIRWNDNYDFWFTSAFFSYYLRDKFDIDIKINDDVKWLERIKEEVDDE